ncbi:unnamed protein product [Cuscuta europaea]|uniref:Uncharacterized protein n=1 Tax=Cuscuta europaea TaxID=41803 RepID=A0A9P1EGU0_CUSEU|nr:unnamed protein product [Cuscuta europaea]
MIDMGLVVSAEGVRSSGFACVLSVPWIGGP